MPISFISTCTSIQRGTIMTIQSLIFLYQLKKAQILEEKFVYINDKEKTICTVSEKGGIVHTIDMAKKWNSVHSMLTYLKGYNLVEWSNNDYARLTHAGFHYYQTLFSSICNFLFRSIAVPIAVAFVTTLITNSLLK